MNLQVAQDGRYRFAVDLTDLQQPSFAVQQID